MPSNRLARLAVPIVVVIVVVMMVVPLPAAVLDVLIAGNIAMSLVVLLVAMQVRKPLEFAVFPTLVLVGTILRLALNVSSTRLVLRDGYAGHVIDAFGHIVIGGSLVIGLVVFAILVVIQLTVVTNGAGTRRRGRRPVHPRRDAGQADGDRRRPELRAHRRGRGTAAPQGGRGRGRLLRRDGRRHEVRQGRRHRRQ